MKAYDLTIGNTEHLENISNILNVKELADLFYKLLKGGFQDTAIAFFKGKISTMAEESQRNLISSIAMTNSLKALKVFENEGADIHYNDNISFSLACKYGSMDIVKYFVKEKKVDVNVGKGICLIFASRWNQLDVAKYLIENGFDLSEYGKIALEEAKNRGNADVLEYLESVIS